jgi:hypothetical protein
MILVLLDDGLVQLVNHTDAIHIVAEIAGVNRLTAVGLRSDQDPADSPGDCHPRPTVGASSISCGNSGGGTPCVWDCYYSKHRNLGVYLVSVTARNLPRINRSELAASVSLTLMQEKQSGGELKFATACYDF